MSNVSYNVTCENYDSNSEKCKWCGYERVSPAPDCYKNPLDKIFKETNHDL